MKAQFASDDIRKPVRYGEGFMDDGTKDRAFLKHYANPFSHWIKFWPLTPEDYRYAPVVMSNISSARCIKVLNIF